MINYQFHKDGLIRAKEFTYDSLPANALKAQEVLSEYNKTVEPENMLYATHKESFELDGRWTGSTIINMSKAERKTIRIDGELTCEVDITSCLPFILCASELKRELLTDPYDIKGTPRALGKKAFHMATNCDSKESARLALQSMINKKYTVQYLASTLLNQLELVDPGLTSYF